MRAAERQRLDDITREHRDHSGTACVICFLLRIIESFLWANGRRWAAGDD